MPKLSMAQLHKCVHPYPVYEAHFADNTVGRMSFWTKNGQPWDFARGRRLLETAHHKTIVAGYVEQDDPAKPWLRTPDPFFTGEEVAPQKRRPKQYKQALIDLIDWLDGNHDDESALTQARDLLAA